ncbi:MAG: double-strand break repair helicase AddA [Asticcacaulis sp.]
MSWQQNEAANPRSHVFVTANAGSGKTSTLVNRVARLLLQGAKPEHILCVTYTKAAAAEMQGRLYERLGHWAVADDRKLAEQLSGIDEDSRDLSKARALFARALETPGGLKIQTIHAFCEKLLRRFPLEAGLSPAFSVLDDLVSKDLSRKAIDQLLTLGGDMGHRDRLIRRLKTTNFERLMGQFIYQHDRIAAQFEALKTKASEAGMNWAAYLFDCVGLDEAISPETVVSRFANSLRWEEVREVARSMAGAGDATNDKVSAGLLELYEARQSDKPFDFDALFYLVHTRDGNLKQRGLFTKKTLAADISWLESLSITLTDTKAKRLAADTAYNSFDALRLFEDFSEIYQRLKTATGQLDFQDLIGKARTLLSDRLMSAWVLFKMDGGLEHILVDEAQDTSEDQWQIVRALSEEFFAGAGAVQTDIRTVFAVGDEKQSIYGFQGAQPERFLGAKQYYQTRAERAELDFNAPDLLESWRSLPEILGFVDAAFDAPELAEALRFRQDKISHIANRSERAACVELWPPVYPLPVAETEDSEEDDIDPVDASAIAPAKRLARQLAFHIKSELDAGRSIIDKATRQPRPMHAGDILILVRKRDALFEHIIRELKTIGVAVSGADRLKLETHIAFEDIRGLMRVCLNPNDSLSLAAILRSPLCDLSETDLFDLLSETSSLWASLVARHDENPRFKSAFGLISWAMSEAPNLTAFDLVGRVLNRKDSDRRTLRQRFVTRLGPECEDVLDETLNLALKAEGVGDIGMIHFLNLCEFNASEIKREQEEGGDRLRVMTVHGSKGLEAPWVILPVGPGHKSNQKSDLLVLSDDHELFLSPSIKSDPSIVRDIRAALTLKDDKEHLRLFYVAVTRARDRLTLCGFQGKRAYNGNYPDWYDLSADGFARLGDTVSAVDMPSVIDFGLPKDVVDDDRDLTRAQVLVYGEVAPLMPQQSKAEVAHSALPEFVSQPPVGDDNQTRWRALSQLSDEDRTSDEQAPSPLSGDKGLGRYGRGLLIHKLFEILPDISQDKRTEVARTWLAKQLNLTAEQQDDIFRSVFAVLEDDRFSAAFSPASRPEVAIAGKLTSGLYLSGRIDQLVIEPERVLVIDYKSNRPAPDTAEGAALAYQRQLAGYVALLKQIYPEHRIEAAFLWTDGPKLTPMNDALIEQRISEIRDVRS